MKHSVRVMFLAAGAVGVVSVIVKRKGVRVTQERLQGIAQEAFRRDLHGKIRDLLKMEYSGSEIARELLSDWKVDTIIRALKQRGFKVDKCSADSYYISDTPVKGREETRGTLVILRDTDAP